MALDALPGFRRRLIVTPSPITVRSDLEDDYHRMSVILHHDGTVATRVEADMMRAPWTTCPGALATLGRTFEGVRLEAFGRRGEKVTNCTHLYDLAVLGAAHAHDAAPTIYDILVADPVAGIWRAELRCNRMAVLRWDVEWNDRGSMLVAPVRLAGMKLDNLRLWIDSLDPESREHARLLRWGTMLAHGRARRYASPAEPRTLPLGQCFSFQPQTAPHAVYVEGSFRDFSGATPGPLAVC